MCWRPFAPEMAQVPAATAEPRDLAKAVEAASFDAIVFDHYGLTEREHRAMSQGWPVLVIDDLADRPLGADLLVDAGPARRVGDYDGLLPDEARLLLGPGYAPVRPGIRRPARGRARLARRTGRPPAGVAGPDRPRRDHRPGGRAPAAADRRDRPSTSCSAPRAPSLPGLTKVARRDARLTLHVDTPHMARLTAEADIAVGAAGSSTWERCTLGLPSVLVILADNQRPAAQALAERGAALVVDAAAPDFEAALDRVLRRLLTDADLRRDLAARSAEICDGQGAPRVAEALPRPDRRPRRLIPTSLTGRLLPGPTMAPCAPSPRFAA